MHLSKRLTEGAILVLVALLVTSVTGAAAAPLERPRAGANHRLGATALATRAKDAPGLAVNPQDTNHIVEVNADVIESTCEAHVSFDAGRTWSGGPLPVPAGFPARACELNRSSINMAGGVAFGANNRVYATFVAARQGENLSVLVARSIDGGRTFSTSVAMAGGAAGGSNRYLQPRLAVQPRAEGDRVFVASVLGGRLRQGPAMVSRSDDSGATWAPPVDASNGQQVAEMSQPVVTVSGVVALSWQTAPTLYVTPTALTVARSLDNGRTWLPITPAPSSQPSLFPRLAADPRADRLYVVYMEGPPPASGYVAPQRTTEDDYISPDADVFLVRSADGGLTWSGPVRVNDDPVGNNIAQRHPNLSVAPNGRVDVVWHDRRNAYKAPVNAHAGNGEARLGDTYYAFSTDGGASFSRNRRVTDRMINNDVGLDYRCCNYWFSGPVSAPLGPDRVLVAWTDSREGSFDTDAEDIYLATVDLAGGQQPPVQRLAANGPSQRSIMLSRLAYPGGPEAVLAPTTFANQSVTKLVVVNENDPASAMAGAVLSRANLGPLLATPAGSLTPELQAEAGRMAPIGAFLVGDTAGLSTAVADQLAAAGIPPDKIARLSGTSPAEVAARVAEAMDRRSADNRRAGSGVPAFDAAVVANPLAPESPTAAALAAALRLPYLFVDRDSVPKATSDALSSLAIERTLVIGGAGAVSEQVISQLPSPKRLAGDGPIATAEAVAAEALDRGLPHNQVFVADATSPLDTALLGALAARLGGLVLVDGGESRTGVEGVVRRLGLTPLVDRIVSVRGSGPADGPGSSSVGASGPVPAPTLPATGGGSLTTTAGALLAAGLFGLRTTRGSWWAQGPTQWVHPRCRTRPARRTGSPGGTSAGAARRNRASMIPCRPGPRPAAECGRRRWRLPR